MNIAIPLIRMTVGELLARISLLLIVILWSIPTFGLLVSSFRTRDAIATTGWWTSLLTNVQTAVFRTGTEGEQVGEEYVISGTHFEDSRIAENATITAFGTTANNPSEFVAGETVPLDDGGSITIYADGRYELRLPQQPERGLRFSFTANVPSRYTLANYTDILIAPPGSDRNVWEAFINTFTVTIPSTIIPIAVALFAAYAFSWMNFPGRLVLFAVVVGLLVVPLQMSLIPLLRLYANNATFLNENLIQVLNTGILADSGFQLAELRPKSYLGIWLAHTGFGLPLAIYLLRNYIGSLPKEIIESAQIDGASHFTIFTRLILPLSLPAIASFSIFQFLWVWNDLLVALVFLTKDPNQIVLTSRLREYLGSRGGDWDVLSASAFISIAVPIMVFFALQRYFVRGLLAGSVKGG